MEGLPLVDKPRYTPQVFLNPLTNAQYNNQLLNWISTFSGDASGLQDQISANRIDIDFNSANISNNATNIATNADNIESNANAMTEYNAKFDSILIGDYWDGKDVVTTGSFEFGKIIAGEPGFEGSGVNIHGVIYDSSAKVSDLGGVNEAQLLLHRHSTTLPPVIVSAYSHSDDENHSIVLDNDIFFGVYGAGWSGSHYDLGASITFEVDGTPGADDMPGRIVLSTTPDGAFVPVEAGRFNSSQQLKLANALELTEGGTGASTASGARTNLDVDVAGTDNSTNVSLAGTPNYITIVGQVITRASISLTSHITGILPLANGGTNDAAVTSANIGHLKAMDQDVGSADNVDFAQLTTSAKIIVNDTTDSTSTTTGSIQTDGGLGVVKKLHVGGELVLSNDLTVNRGTNAISWELDSNRASSGQTLANISGLWNGNPVTQIRFTAGNDAVNKDNGIMTLRTAASLGGGLIERVKINEIGEVFLNLPPAAGTTGSLWNDSGTVKVA